MCSQPLLIASFFLNILKLYYDQILAENAGLAVVAIFPYSFNQYRKFDRIYA